MAKDDKPLFYKVFFTPLISRDGTYGDAIEVTEYITMDGLPKIRRSIDAGDYDIGVFTFSDVNIKADNFNGMFNSVEDRRSIFPVTRDKTLVEIRFTQLDDDDGNTTETITFKGLINDEATRVDFVGDGVSFKVLSKDSIIRKTNVPAGTVSSGTSAQNALFQILNNPEISNVLTIDIANINPNLDLTIDVGSEFDDEPASSAINDILKATNSVMLIENDTVFIQSRIEDETADIIELFGPFDIHGRENILSLNRFNTGLQRMFNSVKISSVVKNNATLQQEFGFRQKSFSFPFLTDLTTISDVANRLVEEFKTPKIELSVTVATSLVRDIQLLDRFTINYPLRIKPIEGKNLPVVGVTAIGDTDEPLPDTFGSGSISNLLLFKAIQIDENPKQFQTTLKLRQTGTELNDGVINFPGNCIVGFAVIGDCEIKAGDTDGFNPSVVGAAQIGETKVS